MAAGAARVLSAGVMLVLVLACAYLALKILAPKTLAAKLRGDARETGKASAHSRWAERVENGPFDGICPDMGFKETPDEVLGGGNAGRCTVNHVHPGSGKGNAPGGKWSCAPFANATLKFPDAPVLKSMPWCTWSEEEDMAISAMLIRGYWPPGEKQVLDFFGAHINCQKPGMIIDAGTQVGMFSAASLAAGHFVMSVDIKPEHVQMNLVSQQLNHASDRHMIVQGALGNMCGLKVSLPKKHEAINPGATFVDKGKMSDGWLFATERDSLYDAQVKTHTLDDIIEHALNEAPKKFARHIYAMKIDIEGFEPRAFMGSSRMMMDASLRPDIIVMELFVHRFKDCDYKQFLRMFVKLGYTIDVYKRLNMKESPKGLNGNTIEKFLGMLSPNAEMDVVMLLPGRTVCPAEKEMLSKAPST